MFKSLIILFFSVCIFGLASCSFSGKKSSKTDLEEDDVFSSAEVEEVGTPEDDEDSMMADMFDDGETELSETSEPDYEDSEPVASSDDSESDSSIETQEEAPKKIISLRKIPVNPWKREGQWINSIYIARDGDSLSSIASQIYNNSDPSLLQKINSHLRNREVVVGDKVFYGSIKRPDDSQRFLTYYEDQGIPASSIAIQAGDNIRTFSKNLLGHDKSWKEIWATNPDIESKGIINEMTMIQFWPADIMAQVEATAIQQQEEMKKQMMEKTEPLAEALEEPAAIPEFDPIETMPEEVPSLEEELVSGTSMEKIKIYGLVGIIFLIIILLITRIIRKRNARSELDFSQTNIDIDSIEE